MKLVCMFFYLSKKLFKLKCILGCFINKGTISTTYKTGYFCVNFIADSMDSICKKCVKNLLGTLQKCTYITQKMHFISKSCDILGSLLIKTFCGVSRLSLSKIMSKQVNNLNKQNALKISRKSENPSINY